MERIVLWCENRILSLRALNDCILQVTDSINRNRNDVAFVQREIAVGNNAGTGQQESSMRKIVIAK